MILAPKNCNGYDREPHLRNKPDSLNEIGYTPERWLNEYTLMCGYQEFLESDTNRTLRMYYEGGVFQIIAYDHANHHCILWETLEDLDEARELFANAAMMHLPEGDLR